MMSLRLQNRAMSTRMPTLTISTYVHDRTNNGQTIADWQYRMNIPIVDPRATEDMITDKKYYPNVYQPLAPKHIGNKGESGILKWGPQAHGLTLNVGTLAQIAQNWVGNDGIKGDGLPANMTVPDNNLSGSSSISKISSAASTAATGKSSAAASTGK